ncbi:MAG: peptidase M16 [Patescibacteria group bacterium]|nr:MAG: peptidase M16 [Patescibacteria group bacterium]
MNYQRFKLSNNIDSLVIKKSSLPSVTFLVLVKAGSRYEDKEKNGLAHFLEHLVFKGTKKYKKAGDISFSIERTGGYINAFTSNSYTGFYIKTQSNYIDEALDVLSSLIFEPLFRKQDVNLEKGVVCEEIRMYNDMPKYRVSHIFDQILFRSSLSYPILGSVKTVSSLTSEDLFHFMDRLYTSDSIKIIIVGNIDSSIENKLEKYFGKQKINSKQDITLKYEESLTPRQTKKIVIDKVQQAHLVFGLKVPLEDEIKAKIFSVILGGGMASWLFQYLREENGWAYYVGSETEFFDDVGALYVKAGVVNSHKVVSDVLSYIQDCFYSFEGRLSDNDLIRAKEYLKGNILLSLEDNFNLAYFLGKRFILKGKIITPDDILEEINSVTKSDVVATVNNLISKSKFATAVITSDKSLKSDD